MEKLQLSQEASPECTVFTLQGAFTLEGLFAVQSAFRADLAPLTIIDLSSVPYVDSAGIGVLVNAQVSREKNGRRLILAGATDRVKQTLEITKVAQILHFADSIEQAKATPA